jgi:SAM-dependent methyltransferase
MRDDWLPMPRYKLRKDLVRRMLKREALEGKTCLELGYGAGDMLLMYAELGLTVYGFDISEEAFQNAKLRVENHGKINLCENGADAYNQKYDYIMAFEVLEHVEDDASCVREWWEMLEDSGRLLISVPAHASKWGASDVAVGHYRRYEKQDLSEMLWHSGFRILRLWNYAYPISVLLDVFSNRQYRAGSKNNLSKEELSKRSGIKRKNSLLNKLLASNPFLFPFFLMQRLFLHSDLSSAYLIVAEKIPRNGRL